VVVPGTYHNVPPAPVGMFQAVVAVPKGLVDAASVVFLVFLVGGAFAVVEQTGPPGDAVAWLAKRLGRRETLVIPITVLAFALGGITENMQEEIIAFVPILLLLTRRLGFDPLTDHPIEVGVGHLDGSVQPDRLPAVGALGTGGQTLEVHPVQRGTERTADSDGAARIGGRTHASV
jgi:hypothetical protein